MSTPYSKQTTTDIATAKNARKHPRTDDSISSLLNNPDEKTSFKSCTHLQKVTPYDLFPEKFAILGRVLTRDDVKSFESITTGAFPYVADIDGQPLTQLSTTPVSSVKIVKDSQINRLIALATGIFGKKFSRETFIEFASKNEGFINDIKRCPFETS
ncbi:hypothetical protein BB561_001380 [Smittium simulii]|uniref:Uncharacterized protein n=1 Tax=Smittium simulii TaxID=133385 RepID=A0A2T9YUZ9_9FUNG|nr:hypothetical protein BB561_001380 [Smittium simulii]